MGTIKELAIEAAKIINEDTFGSYTRGYGDGANAVLEKIESLIGNTSGEGEVYHYNFYMELQKLIKGLKGK